MAFEMNMLKATTLPVKHRTSFGLVGDYMSIKACIFLGLASMAIWVTMRPKNLPLLTPKAHLVG